MKSILLRPMVTIGMDYHVLPGKEEVFERAFHQVLETMKTIEGHEKSFLFKESIKPSHFLIVSEWSSEDAFNGFVRSEAFAKVTNWGKENILESRPKHSVYKH